MKDYKETRLKPSKLSNYFFYGSIVLIAVVFIAAITDIYIKKEKFDACLSSIEGTDAECDSCYYSIYTKK